MKKMFSIVVILLLLYIISQTIYSYTRGSRVTKYNLVIDEVEYQIKENFTSGFKTEKLIVLKKVITILKLTLMMAP